MVDTVGVKIGPFASIDQYGTPHTEALHVIERYRLLDYDAMIEAEARGERENFHLDTSDAGFSRDLAYTGKGLQLEFRVEDEGVFTTPWSATMTYRRPLSGLGQWPEMVWRMWTAPSARGKGVARAVLRKLEASAREVGLARGGREKFKAFPAAGMNRRSRTFSTSLLCVPRTRGDEPFWLKYSNY